MDARTANSDSFALTTPSDRELVLTRVFDAPRLLVFEAWTKPEHLMRWYGCRITRLLACDIDLRPGGSYRFVMRIADGEQHTMSGVYREIVPPARLVYTERFNDNPDKEALVTFTLSERNGRTTMTSTIRYRSAEDRDAVLKFGVEKGAVETLDRLEEYLPTMA